MKTFTVRNTNHAMYPVYSWLYAEGVLQESRAGKVLRAPCPVTITYTHPMERVNFCPVRDANPFFHLLEAVWMLAGSNGIIPLLRVLPSFADFSDDGRTHNAAYGYRARVQWGDQLQAAAQELTASPTSRQVVVQLWDPADLTKQTKDKACNTQLMFSVDPLDGRLNMLVTNRSNDAIWGAVSGANIVHMAFFLEYVAWAARIAPGKIVVVSNNLHAYIGNPKYAALMDKYASPQIVEDYPGWASIDDSVDRNWSYVVTDDLISVPNDKSFWYHTVRWALLAHKWYRQGVVDNALHCASSIAAPDWRKACIEWLQRRADK